MNLRQAHARLLNDSTLRAKGITLDLRTVQRRVATLTERDEIVGRRAYSSSNAPILITVAEYKTLKQDVLKRRAGRRWKK